ncbi:MAG: hypothetical protein F4X57_06440 [Chloroflexi bacterium]|nr:hypothetical protein [Chloroflexota bacterium]
MSLLDEIRSDLVNESADISNTLRKAKILASAMGLPEFREWVDSELSGYTDMDKVPSYRRVRPTNLGTFSGPFQGGVKNMVLPTYNLPDEIREFAENLIFFDGVGALEAQGTSTHQRKWPQEMVMLAQDSIQMTGGMVLVDAHQPVPAYVISGVLDQVKNRLLDFVLGLQESNVTSEDLDNRSVEREVARNLFNINIYGDRNIVASGEQVNQRVETVQEGDIDSLVSVLREFNINDKDLSELKSAISADPSAPGSNYGPKVREWLGGMISKAASSTWNVGLQTASKVLTEALNGYYGL